MPDLEKQLLRKGQRRNREGRRHEGNQAATRQARRPAAERRSKRRVKGWQRQASAAVTPPQTFTLLFMRSSACAASLPAYRPQSLSAGANYPSPTASPVAPARKPSDATPHARFSLCAGLRAVRLFRRPNTGGEANSIQTAIASAKESLKANMPAEVAATERKSRTPTGTKPSSTCFAKPTPRSYRSSKKPRVLIPNAWHKHAGSSQLLGGQSPAKPCQNLEAHSDAGPRPVARPTGSGTACNRATDAGYSRSDPDACALNDDFRCRSSRSVQAGELRGGPNDSSLPSVRRSSPPSRKPRGATAASSSLRTT